MRGNIIILLSVAVIGFFALSFVWPHVPMGLTSSARYTQADTREYEYYTPDLLKRMPRISGDYEFSYSNISGPQAFVYGMQFNGTTDTRQIREYLIAEGYERQTQCQTEAECWRFPRGGDVVSFYSLPELDFVSVEIYRREHVD